jgi:hypothetical protein
MEGGDCSCPKPCMDKAASHVGWQHPPVTTGAERLTARWRGDRVVND